MVVLGWFVFPSQTVDRVVACLKTPQVTRTQIKTDNLSCSASHSFTRLLTGSARVVCRNACVHRSLCVLYVEPRWVTVLKLLNLRLSFNLLWQPVRDVECRCVWLKSKNEWYCCFFKNGRMLTVFSHIWSNHRDGRCNNCKCIFCCCCCLLFLFCVSSSPAPGKGWPF